MVRNYINISMLELPHGKPELPQTCKYLLYHNFTRSESWQRLNLYHQTEHKISYLVIYLNSLLHVRQACNACWNRVRN